jgi:hypothetical protein
MIIRVDDSLTLEVNLNVFDREEGYEDDVRFALRESGPKEMKLFPADEISFLLTADQAEQLALALHNAAEASRNTPR